MNIGVLFSFCAGILIGLKMFYKIHNKRKNKNLKNLNYPINDYQINEGQKQQHHENFSDAEKGMYKLLAKKYGSVLIGQDTNRGTCYVYLGDNKFMVSEDYMELSKRDKFWHDLWYGSGCKSGKDG